MKVSGRLAMITALLVAMIIIATLCLTHPLIEKQHCSRNAPSLGIPIDFAQVPSTINNSLPPSDIISWIDTGQEINLTKAQQDLQNICQGFTNVTNTFIECYLRYYPFQNWGDTNDFINIYVRVYSNGLVVTYVPHINEQTLILSLNVSSSTVELQTDVVLLKVLKLLGINGFSENEVYHGTSVYTNAKYMKILWSNVEISDPYYGYPANIRLGEYTIYDNSSIVKGFLAWLVDWYVSESPDTVRLTVYYNSSSTILSLSPSGTYTFVDMVSNKLLNVGTYDYWLTHNLAPTDDVAGWDHVVTQVVMVLLLKG